MTKRGVGVALVMALAAAGCSGESDRGRVEMTADLERDLAMATEVPASRTAVVSAIEGGPTGAPSGNARGRRDAVRTPRRAPRPQPAAVEQEVSAPETVTQDPMPVTPTVTETVTPAPVPVPEPAVAAPAPDVTGDAPVSGPSAGSNEGTAEGTSGRGRRGGIGGVIGAIGGAIIRGGHVGVDDCAEHDRRAGRRGRDTRIPEEVIGTMIGGAIARGGWGGPVIRPVIGGDNRAPVSVGRGARPRF